MKRTKRIFAIFMTLALAMSMMIASSVASFAADVPTPEGGFTVTITQNPNDKGTHTYEAYQIFSGKLSSEIKDSKTVYTLSDLNWGSGIKEADKESLGSAKTYAEGMNDANADAKAAELASHLSTTTSGTYANGKITGLQPGYYLIQDTSTSPVSDSDNTKPAAKTKFILKVVADQTVAAKSSVPTVEKKVKEKNDTTGIETGWQDAADYDVNDIIPYQVTATIGSGIDNFSKYSLKFEDDMSKGLTLQDGWTIKVVNTGSDDVDVTSAFTKGTGTSTYTGGAMHTWSVTDLKGVQGVTLKEGTQVVLSYNAKLNSNAVIGSEGNPNTVVLKFDNNPNKCGEGTPNGSTPEDKNIVFTYEIKALKVAPTSDAAIDKDAYDALSAEEKAAYVKIGEKYQKTQALSGAGFTLYKKVPAGTAGAVDGYVAVGEEIKGVTTFEFKGTDAGEYKLVETTIPAGYDKAADITFTVNATYDTNAANPKLKTLTVTPDTAGFTVTTTAIQGDSEHITTDGIISGKVLNQKGATLPETGGIGTVIFYVLGTLLVVGCGIVLISKRRMENR